MLDVLCAAASIVLLCCATVIRPTRARCPVGFDLRTGVRRDGHFTCWPAPLGAPHWDARIGAWVDDGVQPGWRLGGRVVCTGGTEPRQDGTSVWCARTGGGR